MRGLLGGHEPTLGAAGGPCDLADSYGSGTHLKPPPPLRQLDGGGGGDGSNNEQRSSHDLSEFAAFVSWYLFLIICCVCPTLCIYRRRVSQARRLRELELALQQRHLQGGDIGTGGSDFVQVGTTEWRDQRKKLLKKQWAGTKMTVRQSDLLSIETPSVDVDAGTIPVFCHDDDEDDVTCGMIIGVETAKSVVSKGKKVGTEPSNTDVIDDKEKSPPLEQEERTTPGPENEIDAGDSDGCTKSSSSLEQHERTTSGPEHENDAGDADGCAKSSSSVSRAIPTESAVSDGSKVDDVVTTEKLVDEQKLSLMTEDGENGQITDTAHTNLPTAGDCPNNGRDSVVDVEACVECSPSAEEGHLAGTRVLQLRPPERSSTANERCVNGEPRQIPNSCAICLSPYEVGSNVIWSDNTSCSHAFHEDCITSWVLRKFEEDPSRRAAMCPCCRQEFVHIDEEESSAAHNMTQESSGENRGDESGGTGRQASNAEGGFGGAGMMIRTSGQQQVFGSGRLSISTNQDGVLVIQPRNTPQSSTPVVVYLNF